MKLTVAMHSVGRAALGESRDLASSGRPQLMRHPLARPITLLLVLLSFSTQQSAQADENWPPPLPKGATQAVLIHRVEAKERPLQELFKLKGALILKCVIEPDGTVSRVKIERSTHPVVDAAWREAVLQWRYRPATLDGKPIRISFTIVINAHPENWPRVTPTPRGAG